MKVLYFIDRLRLGGIQALALDIVRHKPQELTIDILTLDDGEHYELEDTMKSKGVTVYKLNGIWFRTPLSYLPYFKAVNKFFENHHDYDAIHMHSSSKNFYILQCAKKWAIPVRIAHAHNTGFQSHNLFSIMLGNLLKILVKKYANVWCGCSQMAYNWLFGTPSQSHRNHFVTKNEVNSGKNVIINGIEPGIFSYNRNTRDSIRRELNIEDKFVVGHVGRFEKQKNHTFLLEVFARIAQKREDAVLMLIGKGSLEQEIKMKAESLGISDKVLFLGFKDNRQDYMQAMDTFLFPSLYEGLSVVLIEAQAAGLPVLVSDSTTRETTATSYIHFKNLLDGAESWAESLLSIGCNSDEDRRQASMLIEGTEFDIKVMVQHLINIYKAA